MRVDPDLYEPVTTLGSEQREASAVTLILAVTGATAVAVLVGKVLLLLLIG